MATAITEKPMASAIVTAQTEIHMIGPMMVHRQRAYGDLVPAGGHKCRDQTGHERGQLRQFRDVRVPITRWVKSIKAAHRALAAVQSRPHIAGMATTFPPAYELTTRPCTIHAGRYRWVITGNGKPVQTSADSFETSELAHMDGRIAFEKLVQSSRINE
jgi:hypothetical protein